MKTLSTPFILIFSAALYLLKDKSRKEKLATLNPYFEKEMISLTNALEWKGSFANAVLYTACDIIEDKYFEHASYHYWVMDTALKVTKN
jgi:hypothetical protein